MQSICAHCCLLLLLGILSATITCIDSEPNISSICQQQKSCGHCIAISTECHWCSDETIVGVFERCDVLLNLKVNGCRLILSPNTTITSVKNESLRNADVNINQEAIQLAPQQINIKLRTKQQYTFPVTFRQAEDYPVDIYFLMDLSNTMRNYQALLVNVAEAMALEIGKITKDIRYGFGSFVDKPTLPFADWSYTAIAGDVPAYNFKNILNLTKNVQTFKQIVNESRFSSNVDVPEAGLDAIMQALTCKKEIGWRENARRLVLLFTDDIFHAAGDGKVGGALLPNDEQCHLDKDGSYTEALDRDYPTISQIATQVALNKVSLIFAVTREHIPLYTRLSAHIPGSAVGLLTNNADGLISIVRDNYQSISSSIELKTETKTNADKEILVSYQTTCPNGVSSTVPKCSDIKIGQSVVFSLTVQIKSCPSTQNSRWTLEISPIGLSDKLIVNIDAVCDCDCKKEINSVKCNENGVRECGICTCNSGSFGDRCECASPDLCIKPSSTESCDGHGSCECAACNCSRINQYSDNRYSGRFCECNDYNCDYFDGELCGGPSRGVCKCSQCVCKSSYSGPGCHCLNNITLCMDEQKAVCGNKGECICGECVCQDNYSGPTCNNCPSCKEKCEEVYKPCAQCYLRTKESPEVACRMNCTSVTETQLVDKIPECGADCLRCQYTDESDLCEASFVFRFSNSILMVQTTKEKCQRSIPTWVIIAVVVSVMIVIGIILLIIWKVIITIHDQREYAAFEREMANIKFSMTENRIYKGATTTFQNPSFGNKKMS